MDTWVQNPSLDVHPNKTIFNLKYKVNILDLPISLDNGFIKIASQFIRLCYNDYDTVTTVAS